jgi:hypothetical protein
MIELDLTNYRSKWHHSEYELYLGALLNKLEFHCELYPEDEKMSHCMNEILSFYEEILQDDDGGCMMKPVEIKIFDSLEEARQWEETANEFVLSYGLCEQEELVFVKEYEKIFPYTVVFDSKIEAEEWIISEELKIEPIAPNLENKLLIKDVREYNEAILTRFELKKYGGNLYCVDRFDIVGTNKGYLFYGKEQLQNWLLNNHHQD